MNPAFKEILARLKSELKAHQETLNTLTGTFFDLEYKLIEAIDAANKPPVPNPPAIPACVVSITNLENNKAAELIQVPNSIVLEMLHVIYSIHEATKRISIFRYLRDWVTTTYPGKELSYFIELNENDIKTLAEHGILGYGTGIYVAIVPFAYKQDSIIN
jgi:hypothetical protein